MSIRLETVYNRGFWGGYFLGQELGDWTDSSSGSKATVKKVFLGKGMHYYYGMRRLESLKLKLNSLRLVTVALITGPTTGVVETTVRSKCG